MKIHVFEDEDLVWDFQKGTPYVVLNNATADVDPFPCYSHPYSLVRELVSKLPIQIPTDWYLLNREVTARVNGWADRAYVHDKETDTWKPKAYFVVLSGKRIPIHPAMTRHLVGHEYGHVIEFYLCNKFDLKKEEFLKRYAEFRGIKYSAAYGGRNWATNTGEVFANDARSILCDLEHEFWPHAVPKSVSNEVYDWWQSLNLPESDWELF